MLKPLTHLFYFCVAVVTGGFAAYAAKQKLLRLASHDIRSAAFAAALIGLSPPSAASPLTRRLTKVATQLL